MKRYIGNKEKLLDSIDTFLSKHGLVNGVMLDLYAGTGSVSSYFRSKFHIIANDIMHYSFVTLKAKLSFKGKPKFSKFLDIYKVDPINYLNTLKIKKSPKNYVWINFSPKGGRMYFTEKNAIKIDVARIFIDEQLKKKNITQNEWFYLLACILSAANSKGNTSGTFGAFLKKFSSSSLKTIEFKHIDTNIGYKGKVYMEDGKSLVKRISCEVLYLDPPYTAIDYSQAYHLLETLSLYDSPELKGITGRRINNQKVSNYTKARTALEEFDKTLKFASKSKNVLLSYSTHGIMSLLDIKKTICKYYKECIVHKISYQKYRNIFSNDKGNLQELLILGRGRK